MNLRCCFIFFFGFHFLAAEGASVSICLHHKNASLDFVDSHAFRDWIVPKRASDMGEGIFGHVWIWVQPPFYSAQKAFELGHTGETDLGQKTYLECFVKQSQIQGREPLRVFFEDRWDGAAQWSSGGHIPDDVWTLSLSDDEYERLIKWIDSGYYDFRRYNVALHQCSHFVVEMLSLFSIELRSPTPVTLPKKVSIWGLNIELWHDAQWSQVAFWTPFELSKALEKEKRFQKTKNLYLQTNERFYSLNPIVRLWQRKNIVKRFFTYFFSQIEREIWAMGFDATFKDTSEP